MKGYYCRYKYYTEGSDYDECHKSSFCAYNYSTDAGVDYCNY